MPDSSDDESEAKAPLSTMEQMLQVIMENQEKAEERAYECRSLIAAISYLSDGFLQQQITVASVLDSLKDAGSMPAGLETLPQDSIDMAVQLKSTVSHLKEIRRDETAGAGCAASRFERLRGSSGGLVGRNRFLARNR
jgi:hypothetical protein